jgi:hypothetical protein
MEIKPPGTGQPIFDPSQNAGSVEQKTGKFEAKLQSAAGSESPSSLSSAVRELKSRFSKHDLDDNTKLDSILNCAVRELMLDKLPQGLQLGESHKQFLTAWMAKDPVIQAKLMPLLRRILDDGSATSNQTKE